MKRPKTMKLLGSAVGGVILVVCYALGIIEIPQSPSSKPQAPASSQPAPSRGLSDAGTQAIADAFAKHRSNVDVEFDCSIKKVLADDLEPPRHQRFIVRLSNDMTVLIAHNTDLAPRVPADEGDSLRISGEYEWNEQGGVVHWTHHDPQKRRRGGWIEHRGKRYE